MMNRPDWDDQFSETEDERNARLRDRRLKGVAPKPETEGERLLREDLERAEARRDSRQTSLPIDDAGGK